MGYELHIVRKNEWDNDEEESNISLSEWLDYVKNDSELELANGYELNIPNVFQRWIERPGYSNWLSHTIDEKAIHPWFDFSYGSISTKYPDDETIKKMISIAQSLNAKVQGDDGEFYDESYFQKQNQVIKQKSANDNKAWWKFW